MRSNTFKSMLGGICLATMLFAGSAKAINIDFGVSWPVYTSPGAGNYAVDPYNLVLGTVAGQSANETSVANALNSIASTTFTAADIHKTNVGDTTQINGPNGYFVVPSGWNYLVVQYDGPNGGSVIIQLNGNSANVPWDSSAIWGTGNQYAMSHWSVVDPTPEQVPDGGATLALLGVGLVGLEHLRRRFLRA